MARSETAQQLATLRAKLQQANPQIYRHWALYLQVLRDELEGVVNKACFQLAVSELPLRYTAMPAAARRQLHRRLARLVKRTAALLTVEQLLALAQQTERRLQRLALRQQRRLLAAMQSDFREHEHPPDPPGSVRLELALPVQGDLFGLTQHQPQSESWRQGGQATDRDEGHPSAAEQDSEALLQVFASLLQRENSTAEADHDGSETGLLPLQPLRLLGWFDSLEGALARRLRNLSHAINVELVRQGLSNTLLPLRTLEAIAEGQLETQDAPLHLVRVAMPGMRLPVGRVPEVLAVLLRPTDLEADAPRLRTCRTRLQQARQEVRRMAQIYQRLERRLQALDAEALWLHDHSTAHLSPSPPTV